VLEIMPSGGSGDGEKRSGARPRSRPRKKAPRRTKTPANNERRDKVQDDTYKYFRGLLGFHPGVARGERLRIGVQMITQRLGRSITDASIEQLFDESLIDELEKERI